MRPGRTAVTAALLGLVFLFGLLGPFRGGSAGSAARAAADSGVRHGPPVPPSPGSGESPRSDEWPLDKLQAQKLWALAPGEGSDVTVAVVDTGIALNEPALKGTAIVQGLPPQPDNLTDSNGTEVAELIAGSQVGLAPKARLIDIYAASGVRAVTASGIATGIRQAVEAGAEIINVSLGVSVPKGSPAYNSIKQAADYAFKSGCLVVASVGSDTVTAHGAGAQYPADIPGVIAVAATGESMTPGPPLAGHGSLAVYAPGINVTAANRNGVTLDNLSGNGFAAAYVSAAAALIWSAHPRLPASQLAWLLVYGTTNPPVPQASSQEVLDPQQDLQYLQYHGQTRPSTGQPRSAAATSPAGKTSPSPGSATGPKHLSHLGAVALIVVGVLTVLAFLAFLAFRNGRWPPWSGGGDNIPVPFDWDLEPR